MRAEATKTATTKTSLRPAIGAAKQLEELNEREDNHRRYARASAVVPDLGRFLFAARARSGARRSKLRFIKVDEFRGMVTPTKEAPPAWSEEATSGSPQAQEEARAREPLLCCRRRLH